MFAERFRSHHDAEGSLEALLKKPKGHLGRLFRMASWPAVEKKLQECPRGLPRGIYIHIPYCDRICSFCNLNRKERNNADLDEYAAYVAGELKTFGAYPYIREQAFDTVYFGGGTPTTLSTPQLGLILDALHAHIPLAADCEITVETTQHNLGVKKAAALADMGVNRFSVGIQTFADRGRKVLGRTYSGEKALEDLQALRSVFKGVLGIDIIYSYPDQSLEELQGDAEICISSGIDSVSFYSLMIHKGSSLALSIEKKETKFIRDIEWDRERHHLFYRRLREAGFELLELSKLARPGKDAYRYIHIQYENGELLPIGAGAGGRLAGFGIYSMAPGRRFVSAPDPGYEKYYRILGLLQFGRYDAEKIAGYLGPRAEERVKKKIAEYLDRGFLETLDTGGYCLSPEGIFWGNNIAVDMLQAVVGPLG
ncbi:MAG: coproporphyrinogen III oxidase family protein [Spirochaetaceae bacterium]|nr:coproporphyrinogen III oxidase family protein [Spirochaetaceae bacterium]